MYECRAPPTIPPGNETIIDPGDPCSGRRVAINGTTSSRTELTVYCDGMLAGFGQPDGAFDEYFRPGAMAVLELADTDGDGYVSRTEFAAMQHAFGTPADESYFAFDQLDLDGGRPALPRRDDRRGPRVLRGWDESAVGTWFFGRV